MISKLRGRVSSAHVIALAALFVALGGTAYAAATVSTNDIKDGAVTTDKIRNKAVTRQKIADDAVVRRTIKDNAVKTLKIANAAVTNTKVGPDAVDSSKVLDGSIGTTELADAGVTTGKLADAAVDNTKLADASVSSPKLAANAVTAGKLAITPRTTTVDVADGTTALLESPCLAGEKVVGGGATWSAGFSNAQAAGTHLVHSRPNPDLSGWAARGYNGSGGQRTLFVRAICLGA